MKALIASDELQLAGSIIELLPRNGVELALATPVPLELAADRASRLGPELLILVFSSGPEVGLAALSEVRRTLPDTDILVVGPGHEAQLILEALHLGADEYLDQAMLSRDLERALVRLKSRRKNDGVKRCEPGKVISVLAPSGGSGASTLVANMGVALAKKYGQCGLFDLNLCSGDLAALLNLKPRYSFADLCERLQRVDQSMFEQMLTPHPSGACLLAAPPYVVNSHQIAAKVVRRALALARVRFPFVLIDVDNAFSEEQVEALWQSDVILLVLRLDYTSVRNTRRVMDMIAETGIGLERVRLVANCYRQSRQLRPSQAEEALGMRISYYIPHDSARANTAVNKGIPLVLYYPSAKVSWKLIEVAVSMNGWTKGRPSNQ